jgi:acetyl-CoA acetyltransferase
VTTAKFEESAVISGIGKSQVGRRLGRTAIDLTVEAVERAVKDAGLAIGDIDGVSTWPGRLEPSFGYSDVGAHEIIDTFRMSPTWWSGGRESSSQIGAVVNAMLAVSAGLCRHVICFRTVRESSAQSGAGRGAVLPSALGGSLEASDFRQWLVPFGAVSAVNWVAPYATRYLHETAAGRRDLAAIALNGRLNAERNPDAVYRSSMTLDDYLGARMISTPLCLYDCDVPVDGSTALLVSAADRVEDPSRAVLIEAVGTAGSGRWSWDQWSDLSTLPAGRAAEMMWARTGLSVAEVSLAEIYDGFSIFVPMWAEATRLCERHEGLEWANRGFGGLPVNTDGGQLSAGRLHGFGFAYEACLQLRGDAGERQVSQPTVALVTVGGGPLATAMLLRSSS